jgi:2-hydroxy-3-keto-5-methylthiopentenyl-1-phosphate phosphatase
MKTAVQLDFDGTITEEDVSFLLLDTYIGPRWHEYHKDYSSGRIPVGVFNKRVFGMVKAGRKDMTDLVLSSDRVKIRPGLRELAGYCSRKGIRKVIVSNGLVFYIEAILKKMGLNGFEVYAASNRFSPGGMKVAYISPDGAEIEVGFKEAYTRFLKNDGYDVIYIGNGASDIFAARQAGHIFAIDKLLKRCRRENVPCIPFRNFYDVIEGLESLLET